MDDDLWDSLLLPPTHDTMVAKQAKAEARVAENPKRTRKAHNKVRSGCLTCKYGETFSDHTLPFSNRVVGSAGRSATKPNPLVEDVPAQAENATDIPTLAHRKPHPQTLSGLNRHPRNRNPTTELPSPNLQRASF